MLRSASLVTIVVFALLILPARSVAAEGPSITGIPVPEMQSFDRIVTDLMAKWEVPGGAVAVAKDGKLVLAHGYGWADIDLKQLAQPDSLFRICSISKPVTAVTILKLVENGQLDIDAKAFKIIDQLKPLEGASVDPRIHNVTVRDLLQHSGGWDPSRSYDPMFALAHRAADAAGTPRPAGPEAIICYMLGQPLDFSPGAGYAYSNFGYCVLGRIIERITCQSYEQYVSTQILAPMGITGMRIGRTFLKDRAEKEVLYYDYPGANLVPSVFPGAAWLVPAPYGGWHQEALDSHGGWVASAIDLVQFASSIDGLKSPFFLKPETVRLMLSRPTLRVWASSSHYYALGWLVGPVGSSGMNWWHDGSLPGSRTILVRTYHGLAWAALFNTRPKEDSRFINEVDQGLWKAASEVATWPKHDLFPTMVTTTTQTEVKTVSSSLSSLSTITSPTVSEQAVPAPMGLILLTAGLAFISIVGIIYKLKRRAVGSRPEQLNIMCHLW